eukprot:22958_1
MVVDLNNTFKYQVVYITSCGLVSLLILSMLCVAIKHFVSIKTSMVSPNHSAKYLPIMRVGIFSCSFIILHSLNELLFSTNIFISPTINPTQHCSWYGKIRFVLVSSNGLCINFIFIHALNNVFSHAIVIHSNINLFIIKIIVVLEIIAFDAVLLYHGHFSHHPLDDNHSYYVCRGNPIFSQPDHTLIFLLQTTTLTGIVVLFGWNTYRLIKATGNVNTSRLESMVSINIRHLVLNSVGLLSMSIILVLDGYYFKCASIADFITASCVYMMFTFGDEQYTILFGYVHQKLLRIAMQSDTINSLNWGWNSSNSNADDVSSDRVMSPVCMNPKLPKILSVIQEETSVEAIRMDSYSISELIDIN